SVELLTRLKGEELDLAHLHITAWVLAIILLFISFSMYKGGKMKPARILRMILRLDYLLLLYSGGSLFASYLNIGFLVIVKVLSGIWAIISREMSGGKGSRGNPSDSVWTQFFIAVVIAIVLAFGFLHLGILP